MTMKIFGKTLETTLETGRFVGRIDPPIGLFKDRGVRAPFTNDRGDLMGDSPLSVIPLGIPPATGTGHEVARLEQLANDRWR